MVLSIMSVKHAVSSHTSFSTELVVDSIEYFKDRNKIPQIYLYTGIYIYIYIYI